MRVVRYLILCGLPLLAASPVSRSAAAAKQQPVDTIGVWQAPAGLKQIRIWPGPAPDGTFRPQPPESVRTFDDAAAPGGRSQAVFNVADPTMTIVPAQGKNSGTAIIVFPGGGFQMVFLGMEGLEICDWLTAQGITCILSKYRVPGSNDFWDATVQHQVTPEVPRALQDAQRTIRLVRSKARELGIDPKRIGVLGMSAGGYLVAQTSNITKSTYQAVDDIDRISSRPDFAIALYPGHICRDDGAFDPTLPMSKDAPPTFIAQSWDDQTDPVCNSLMYASALDKLGVPTELHLFAKGGHAFALRHPREPIGEWPHLVELWLRQIGMLQVTASSPAHR